MFERLTLATAAFSGWMMGVAVAAPFCLILPGGGSQCIYYDGAACARDANRATNATCSLNPNEVRLSRVANSDYCLVTAQGVSVCGYSDQNTCSHDALLQHGACVKGGGLTRPQPQQVPNDYAPNAGR
jgi:hypothetical protein